MSTLHRLADARFKIRTRTCITHAAAKGRPGSRLVCTTQCDWSSSSWLKGTITPAVIKGQKEHHQQLVKKIRRWIKDHPENYPLDNDGLKEEGETSDLEEDVVELEDDNRGGQTMIGHAQDATRNPVAVGLFAVLLLMVVFQRFT